MGKKINIDLFYEYTATGVLGVTESNRTPTQLVVTGLIEEKWLIDGKSESRSGKASVLIPNSINNQTNFIKKIPLGSKVKFSESAHNKGKSYAHSFSIEVIE